MESYCVEFASILSTIKNMDISKIFDADISTPEFVILTLIDYIATVKGNEGAWVSDIVENTAVTAQAVSKQLRVMEQKGYIKRYTDSNDRRRIEVRMSPLGKSLYSTMQEKHKKFMENVASGFDGDEYKELLRLTRKFLDLYVENIGKIAVK